MKRTIYVVSDRRDRDCVLDVVTPLKEANFDVVHNEAVGVGDSLIGTATRHLSGGVPVVLCATVYAVAFKWARKIVEAAHAIDDSKVFVVEMVPGLDLDRFSLGTVHARHYEDPSLQDLISALEAHFPKESDQPNPAQPQDALDYMDQTMPSTTPSIEALAEFRGQLRQDIAAAYPESLSAGDFLRRTSLVRENRLTRVGVLIVGENPVQCMPSAVIECCEYHGTDRTAASAKTAILGNLPHQIVEANKYIADRVQRGEAPTSHGPYAEPVYAFPMIAVREIIANAVAHRDYSARNLCIHVRLFADRIEISNPGTWTGRNMDSEEASTISRLAGESLRRNFRLASMLTWIRLVEGEGKGILAVVADCEKSGAPLPTVKESDGIITVTVFPCPTPELGAGQGNGHVVVQAPPAQAAVVDAAPGVVNLPVRASLFVGRVAEFELLREVLNGSDKGTAVVHGLGGVGKSALAATYAARCVGEANPVWWITADSPESVSRGLAQLALALLPGRTSLLALQAQAEWATAWLASHEGWLLILDNVEDTADIMPLLARLPSGRVIVTSRRATGWDQLSLLTLRLDVLEPGQAIELLERVAGPPLGNDWLEGAERLCAELGHLPLAIEQAGAYIREGVLSPDEYLALLHQWPDQLLDQVVEGTDPARSIGRIWQLTLDRLSESPLPGDLLRMLSWYGSDSIPLALLEGRAESPRVRAAIRRLAAYNMISLDDSASISVHPLVQALARTPDISDRHRQFADVHAAQGEAVRALREAIPEGWDDPATWPTWRRLMPHLTALVDHTPLERDSAVMLSLISDAGQFLRNQGSVATAVAYAERVLAGAERVYGPGSPHTLAARNDLAGAHRAAGNFKRAIPLLEATLADYERFLSRDHPDALAARSNLAGAYAAVGGLRRAVPLYEQVVADRARILGESHPGTLASRNNLAGAYQDSGDLRRAVPLLESTLADYERVLGRDHPDTLVALGNLARAYEAQGDITRAIEFYQQALDTRSRVLGTDHPDTLAVLNNLAVVHQTRGEFGRAIEFHERALQSRLRVLGPDHPATMASLNNLARARAEDDDLPQAVPLYETSLIDHERVLGPDHPDTMAVRSNLAGAYRALGNMTSAIPLYRQAFLDSIRVLGSDHPLSQTIRRLMPPELRPMLLAERVITHWATTDTSATEKASLVRLLERTLPDEEPVRMLKEGAVSGSLSTHARLQVVDALTAAIEADAGFARELVRVLDEPGSAPGSVTVFASGERSIAAGGNIGVAVTGDSNFSRRE
ncbi:tetratricopeptide repeat protein [Streptomyces sp. NPDC054837]